MTLTKCHIENDTVLLFLICLVFIDCSASSDIEIGIGFEDI